MGILLSFFLLFIMIHFFMHPLGGIPTNLVYERLNDMVKWHAVPLMDAPQIAEFAFAGFFYVLIGQLLIPVLAIAYALQYYSNAERREAKGLYDRLESFGKTSKIYEDVE